ncbi:hypothetical protein PHYPSEUDO_008507 [Phytophthora pseudosyringae]|uniref:Uncharacterized protein n=1 Tax=Phytophthora pseudosyringae TaxID=221518 RepID=A0A8T1VH10_9STRA|nr:hypothetical protein PHYPSEUDO_008507 [Phytophthora pseudosyringae]
MTTIFLKTMSPKRTNPALKRNENEQPERPTSSECSWPKMTITKLLQRDEAKAVDGDDETLELDSFDGGDKADDVMRP